LGLVAYTYLGYPLLIGLAALASRRGRRRADGTDPPGLLTMTVVIAALDEEAVIESKLDDTLAQDYPAERLEVVVVADGSSDRTLELVGRRPEVRLLWAAERLGKAAAINRGAAAASGEVLCFTDANCAFVPGALRALAAEFRDPATAVVSGAKSVVGGGARGRGEGMYWRLESHVKRCEAALGGVMGAPGEICGVRRSAFRPIPAGVVNDDYHLTCDALVRGFRVGYAPGAVAVEEVSSGVADELERHSRIAAGTWQTTLAHLRLANPRRGWVAVAFLSHRVLRSLVVPLLLPLLLVASGRMAGRSRTARALFAAQVGGYGTALVGGLTDRAITAAAFQFALTNLATLRGAWRYCAGRQPVAWRRARRGTWRAADDAARR
jgi:cellulose synthase/poly-beta-1,6-N-acetylglucosamine synthase-like glycosyltransferase